MLKKVGLVIGVLLTAASVSSATPLQLSVDGVTNGAGVVQEVTIAPCSYIVVDIHGPADSPLLGYIIIEEDGLNGGEWVDGSYYEVNYPVVHAAAGDMGGVVAYTESGWGVGYEVTADYTPYSSIEDGLWFEFLYHCTKMDETVTISLWDDAIGYDPGDVVDTIIVHQIPEPMTVTLLGLGGLLLRRRFA